MPMERLTDWVKSAEERANARASYLQSQQRAIESRRAHRQRAIIRYRDSMEMHSRRTGTSGMIGKTPVSLMVARFADTYDAGTEKIARGRERAADMYAKSLDKMANSSEKRRSTREAYRKGLTDGPLGPFMKRDGLLKFLDKQ